MEAYVGAIFSFGFNFAPVGWHLCDGSLLPISQNEALFTLIGTTYGGDGSSTFGVPNLQGRVPVGTGQGTLLSNYVLGQSGGSESATLLVSNLPVHTHPVVSGTLPVSGVLGDQNDPTNNYFGVADVTIGDTYNAQGGSAMGANPQVLSGVAGSSMPIEIMNPYLVVSYCIATVGLYPPRN